MKKVAQKRTPKKKGVVKKKAFLAAFAFCGNVTHACLNSKVGRRTHYEWLEKDAKYAAAFESAQDEAADNLEEEARKRAMGGSDTLLIFLLKGALPEKYRERYEHTGPKGGPFEFTIDINGKEQ